MNSLNKQRMQFKTKKNITEDKENFPENQNYDCLIKKKKKKWIFQKSQNVFQ